MKIICTFLCTLLMTSSYAGQLSQYNKALQQSVQMDSKIQQNNPIGASLSFEPLHYLEDEVCLCELTAKITICFFKPPIFCP